MRNLGALRLDAERAVDVLWLDNDPAHFAALVGGRGWTADQYRDWLSERLRTALLGPA